MEFGIFTEFQCPPGTSEAEAFEESMAQSVAAEVMGYDEVWLAELHFQKDRSVLSAPLVVAGALAAATRKIKIGIAATVDNLSGGRLDFGVGRSGFNEALDIVLKAWTEDRFSYDGKYHQLHDVCVMPKPLQKPHPPLRCASSPNK